MWAVHASARLTGRRRVTPAAYRQGMDTNTRNHSSAGRSVPLDSRREDAGDRAEGPATVTPSSSQQVLPFDDEADEPIGFSLTARARRMISPEDLPALALVPEPAWPVADDPGDTRPSRARALRRAGLSPAAIAEQLQVDPLLIHAWIGVPVGSGQQPIGPTAVGSPMASPSGSDEVAGDALESERSAAFELARAAASDHALRVLAHDPAFAAGLGLLASIVEVDRHAIAITTGDQDVVARILAWLDEELAVDPSRVRLVLRIGRGVAGDLVAHRWATRLQMSRHRVATTRWHDAPEPEAVQALLRVADPGVAATVAGWRDALLDPVQLHPADSAF